MLVSEGSLLSLYDFATVDGVQDNFGSDVTIMFATIGALIQSVISGLVGPVTNYLSKKADVGLQEYVAATQAQRDQYAAYVQSLNVANDAKIRANSWSGAHVMIYLFGLPAAIHWGAVFLASTFKSLEWVIPALPSSYAQAELTIALSFFVLAPTMPIVSSVANVLNRR